MVRTLTDAFSSERWLYGSTLLYLVSITFPSPLGTKYFTNVQAADFTDYSLGGTSYLPWIKEIAPINNTLDPWMNTEQIDDVRLIFINAPTYRDSNGHWFAYYFHESGADPEGSEVKIHLHFHGLADADKLLIFNGFVDFGTVFDIAEGTCSVPCVSPAKYYARDILNEVTTTEFAYAPKRSIGRVKPIIYGSVIKSPCVEVGSGEIGMLRRSLLENDTVVYLEDVDNFPSSGRFIVDEEEISYTGKDSDLNALTGLTRPITAATGTVSSGYTPTTTIFQDSSLTSTYADWWNGWYLTFTSGNNNGESRTINDYDDTNRRFTLDKALSEAPAIGDAYKLSNSLATIHNEGTQILQIFYEIEASGTSSSTTFTSTALNTTAGFADDDLVNYLIEFLDDTGYGRITAHNATSGQVTYAPSISDNGTIALIHKPRYWLVADHAITTLIPEDIKQSSRGLPNYAYNHSFEQWTDSRAEGWTALAGSTWGTDLNQETSSPKLGASNLGINSGKGCSMPADKLRPSARYFIVVWAKGGGNLRVRFNSTVGASAWSRTFPTASPDLIDSATTASWARYSFNWVTPAHVPTDMVLEVESTSGSISVDEIQIYEVGIRTSDHYFSGNSTTNLRASVYFYSRQENKVKVRGGEKKIYNAYFDTIDDSTTALRPTSVYDGDLNSAATLGNKSPAHLYLKATKTTAIKDGNKNYGTVNSAKLIVECMPDKTWTDDYVEVKFNGSVVGKIGKLGGVGSTYGKGQAAATSTMTLKPGVYTAYSDYQGGTQWTVGSSNLIDGSPSTGYFVLFPWGHPYYENQIIEIRATLTGNYSNYIRSITGVRACVAARGYFPYVNYPCGFTTSAVVNGVEITSGSIATSLVASTTPVLWRSDTIAVDNSWDDFYKSTTYISLTTTTINTNFVIWEIWWELDTIDLAEADMGSSSYPLYNKEDVKKWMVPVNGPPTGTLYGDAIATLIPKFMDEGYGYGTKRTGPIQTRAANVLSAAVEIEYGWSTTSTVQGYMPNANFSVIAYAGVTEIWNTSFTGIGAGKHRAFSGFVNLPAGTELKDVEAYNSYITFTGLEPGKTDKGIYIHTCTWHFLTYTDTGAKREDTTGNQENPQAAEAGYWRRYSFDISHLLNSWDDVDNKALELTYTIVSTDDEIELLVYEAWIETGYAETQEEFASVTDVNVTCTGKNITNFAEAIYDILVNQMAVPTNRIDYLDPISTANTDYSFNTAYDKLKTPTGTVTYICGFALTDNTTSWDVLADLARQCRCRLFWEVETNTDKESTPLAQVRLHYRDTQITVSANAPWTQVSLGVTHNIGRRITIERTPEEHLTNKITAYWGKNYASSDYKSSYQAENSGSQTKYGVKPEEWQLWAHDETSASAVIQDLVDFELAQRKDPYILVKTVYPLNLIDLERADIIRISLGWLHPGITQMVCEIIGVRLTPGSGALESVASTDTTEEYGQIDTIELTLRGVPPVISYVGT